MHYSGIIQMERSRWGKTPKKFRGTPEEHTWGTVFASVVAPTKFKPVLLTEKLQ